jgi:hypothetical protein
MNMQFAPIKPLTPAQERFAQLIASGLKASWSYRRCYSQRGSAATVATESSRLRNRPHVAARIRELHQEAQS